MAVRGVSTPGLVDVGNGAPQYEDPADGLVLAAYLMTTDKRGVSALLLQRQLGLSRYETAWMMLHKLRRAMVNAAREPLHGEVEVDDTWIGGPQAGLRGSRQLKGRRAALVMVAVEKPREVLRARSHVRYSRLQEGDDRQVSCPERCSRLDHLHRRSEDLYRPRRGRLQTRLSSATSPTDLRKGAKSVVPLADRAIGNLQQWLTGTYHGVSRAQLQVYLDEFVFRHNRRKTPMAAFQTLLGLGNSTRSYALRPHRRARDLDKTR